MGVINSAIWTTPTPDHFGWTHNHTLAAAREGWQITWTSSTCQYIIACTLDVFLERRNWGDKEADAFVRRHAALGDPLCTLALSVVVQCKLLA